MTALQGFFIWLHYLATTSNQAMAIQGNLDIPNAPVLFGGNALEAFLICLQTGAHFVWYAVVNG